MGKEISMNPGMAGQQSNVNINPDDLEDIVCEKCQNQTFSQVFLFKMVSNQGPLTVFTFKICFLKKVLGKVCEFRDRSTRNSFQENERIY